jgi:hypothetical protein
MLPSAVRLSLSNCTHQLHPCTVLSAAHHIHTRPPDVHVHVCLTYPKSLSHTYSSLELRSSPSIWNCLEDHKTPPSTRTDYRSRLDRGVTTSFPPPSSKDCSSGRNIQTFMLFMVLSRSSSLYSRYFIPLCLCDLSIRCFPMFSHTFIVHICNHATLFLFILGERTGSLLGIFSLSISDFYILIFSHPSYL